MAFSIYHLSFCHLFAITNKSTSCNWNIILKENSHPKSISEVTVVIKYLGWYIWFVWYTVFFFFYSHRNISWHFLTIVFSNSNVLTLVIPCYPFPLVNWFCISLSTLPTIPILFSYFASQLLWFFFCIYVANTN